MLLRLFKNYKTKKQLREEIAFLKGMQRTPIMQVERNVMKVRSCINIDERNIGIPIEYAKKQIARNLADGLEQFIQYDVEEFNDGILVTGTLKIAKK